MTKYSVKYAQNYGIFKEVALFSENIPDTMLVNFCDELSNEIDNCTAVEAVDLETGAIVYGIYADEFYSNEEEPDNCDDDCGFDPYLGCYTDDV